MSELLYENPFGSQMRVVHDANGRIVGSADTWGGSYPTEKLEKGTYTVRMALRHTDVAALERASSRGRVVLRPFSCVRLRCVCERGRSVRLSLADVWVVHGPPPDFPLASPLRVPFH
jgi:YD repeat-containing protein